MKHIPYFKIKKFIAYTYIFFIIILVLKDIFMKAVIQLVKNARVEVLDQKIGSINQGLLLLLGIEKDDNRKKVENLIDKIINLRIFPRDNKMQDSLLDIEGELLIVSQFTLCANYKKGKRPDFSLSADKLLAKELYEYAITYSKKKLKKVENGKFGALMELNLLNYGPQTYWFDF
jgi:D-tyrosyl-tRNA(Tyr) deacylase